MKIAVLSGKGGTGKTTISTNLSKRMKWDYIDCDVEEPNGFLFLKPTIEATQNVTIPVPSIDETRCIHCNQCANVCQFNALAGTNTGVLLFEKLCHGCGACSIVCKNDAITEIPREIGKIDIGKTDEQFCMRGTLNIGEPMATPIIKKMKKNMRLQNTLIDCSPGSSCSVVAAMEEVDYALLITEPTAFGLHDLKIAIELSRKMNIPFGVVVNRWDENHPEMDDYFKKENINVLSKIPYDPFIARQYSLGKMLIDDQKYYDLFFDLGQKIKGVKVCN